MTGKIIAAELDFRINKRIFDWSVPDETVIKLFWGEKTRLE
jgi:hypothetical protein